MLEAVHQGLPMLGIPIQGAQFHDLRRFVDKGVAEMISIPEMTQYSLNQKIQRIFTNYQQ